MAISEQQRQKKLAKEAKKKKEALAKRKKGSSLSKTKAASYATYPIHECLVPDTIFTAGIGNVLISRKAPDGYIAASLFTVDVYCLGVKNAFFKVVNKFDYEDNVKEPLFDSHEGATFKSVSPSCARKLIEGSVAYAAELGFTYHRDYKNAAGIFGDIDSSTCPENYEYGQNGKPFYVQGPKETPTQAKRIVDQLRSHCGEGGFHFLIVGPRESF